MLNRFCRKDFNFEMSNTYVSTIGVDFRLVWLLNHSREHTQKKQINQSTQPKQDLVKLQIWDTAGQEKYNSMTSTYWRRAHGLIIVYCIDDKASLIRAKSTLLQVREQVSSKDTLCPCILVGNKVDLYEQRQVTTNEGRSVALEFGCLFAECSAKDAASVSDVFYALTGRILETTQPEDMIDGRNSISKTGQHINLSASSSQSNSKLTSCC
jgi:small GTP-binding protein